jgi:hypothetical protein
VEGRDLVDDGEGADEDAAGWLAGAGTAVVSVRVVVLVVVVHVEVEVEVEAEVGGIHDDQVVDNVREDDALGQALLGEGQALRQLVLSPLVHGGEGTRVERERGACRVSRADERATRAGREGRGGGVVAAGGGKDRRCRQCRQGRQCRAQRFADSLSSPKKAQGPAQTQQRGAGQRWAEGTERRDAQATPAAPMAYPIRIHLSHPAHRLMPV